MKTLRFFTIFQIVVGALFSTAIYGIICVNPLPKANSKRIDVQYKKGDIMKKYKYMFLPALIVSLLLAGCGAKQPAQDAPVESAGTEVATEPASGEDDKEVVATDNSDTKYEDINSIPAYKYTGDKKYMDAISDYLVKNEIEISGDSHAKLYIPYGLIAETDESDPSKIIAYGVFGIDGYDLLNTTLFSVQASVTAGSVTLKTLDDGSFEVTGSDLPYTEEESEEVFKPVKGLYEKITKLYDEPLRKEREDAIAGYVNSNDLYITQFQDYGHLPVQINGAKETPEDAQFYDFKSKLGYSMTYDLRRYSVMSSDDDLYGKVEDEWTGTLMVVDKYDTKDADEAIAKSLEFSNAGKLESSDATIGDGIACKRAAYDETIEDGRIFRYVVYAVPVDDGALTVKIETTVEKGVSEMTVEELEEEFKSMLATFRI